MVMISITMMAVFALGMLFFACSKLLCILGILVSFMFLLLQLNIGPIKALANKTRGVMTALLLLMIFLLGTLTSMSTAEGGLSAYEEELDHIVNLLQKDKLDDAWESINLLKETYGPSDNTIMLEVLAYLGEEDFDKAESAALTYSSRTSIPYYTIMEMVYLAGSNSDKLSMLYEDAANRLPYWTHGQKMAGIALIDKSAFAKAEYHLLRAYEQEPSDFKTAYYLGVTCYEQNRLEEALTYFQESADRDADDQTMGYIAWYAETIGRGGVIDENKE